MGKTESPPCPRCQLFDETTSHILFCQNVQSIISRRDSLRSLEQWFDNNQTRWDIKETILNALRDLQPSTTDNDIFTAARSQDAIGVQNMLEGFVSVEWKTIMSHYYREIKSNRNALSWAAGFHMQMQVFSRAQQQHRNSVVHARNL